MPICPPEQKRWFDYLWTLIRTRLETLSRCQLVSTGLWVGSSEKCQIQARGETGSDKYRRETEVCQTSIRCQWSVYFTTLHARMSYAQYVYRPKVVIANCRPKMLWCDTLAIVHVTLAGIITQNPGYYYCLFTLCEPAIWTIPCLCLSRRRRHHEERHDSDSQCKKTSMAKETVSLQDQTCKKSSISATRTLPWTTISSLASPRLLPCAGYRRRWNSLWHHRYHLISRKMIASSVAQFSYRNLKGEH